MQVPLGSVESLLLLIPQHRVKAATARCARWCSTSPTAAAASMRAPSSGCRASMAGAGHTGVFVDSTTQSQLRAGELQFDDAGPRCRSR